MYLLLLVLEFLLLSWSLVVGSWLLVIAVSELGCLKCCHHYYHGHPDHFDHFHCLIQFLRVQPWEILSMEEFWTIHLPIAGLLTIAKWEPPLCPVLGGNDSVIQAIQVVDIFSSHRLECIWESAPKNRLCHLKFLVTDDSMNINKIWG